MTLSGVLTSFVDKVGFGFAKLSCVTWVHARWFADPRTPEAERKDALAATFSVLNRWLLDRRVCMAALAEGGLVEVRLRAQHPNPVSDAAPCEVLCSFWVPTYRLMASKELNLTSGTASYQRAFRVARVMMSCARLVP